MADSKLAGGIPLDEFSKSVPPGWRPGVDSYPLKLYLEKVKLWYKITDATDEQIGPLLAGRLKGNAEKMALKLQLPKAGRPLADNGFDVGDAAVVRMAIDEVRDPLSGAITQELVPSGVSALLRILLSRYGLNDQDKTTTALDHFFDLRRGRFSLLDYISEFQLRYDDAETLAGLNINDVGKTHLFLRHSGLPETKQDDFKMQLHGDLSRYNDMIGLVTKLAHSPDGEKMLLLADLGWWNNEEEYGTYYDLDQWYTGDDTWYDAWWQGEEHDDTWMQYCNNDDAWYSMNDWWYSDDTWMQFYDSQWQGSDWQEGDCADAAWNSSTQEGNDASTQEHSQTDWSADAYWHDGVRNIDEYDDTDAYWYKGKGEGK